MEYRDRIDIKPDVLGGKPVIKGARVPVEVVVGGLAGGMSFEDIRREYLIEDADIRAALAYAAETLAGEHLIALPC